MRSVLEKWWIFSDLTDSWDHMYTTRNISPTNNQANIVELHPACVYSIRMYSYNKIGRSLPSKELTISTEEARKWLLSPSEITLESFSAFFLNWRHLWILKMTLYLTSYMNSTWRAADGCNPPTNDISEHTRYVEGKIRLICINAFLFLVLFLFTQWSLSWNHCTLQRAVYWPEFGDMKIQHTYKDIFWYYN